MKWKDFVDAILVTASTTAMISLILLGASTFNAFFGFSQLPIFAADSFQNSGLSPMVILVGMIALYVLLGLVMDSLSMILLTVPIFWPIIAGLEFPVQGGELKLWFAIIRPPVGPNVFVINSMEKDVPIIETFKGVLPFFLSDTVRVVFIVMFKTITLILPRLPE